MRAIPAFDLRRQYATIQPEIDAAVREVLHSGWFILGRQCERLEEAFAHYCGVPHAVAVASGTDALHLALRALGIGPGDEVIVPAMTAVPTANAVTAAGATPIFADVERDTCTLDPARLEQKLTPRTRAIIPVHLYGHPADLDPILDLAGRRGLAVVEDCAQAHGTTHRGRPVGSLGTVGCFSFYPTKNLGAYGDGGMVVTGDAGLAHRLRQLRHHGQEGTYHHTIVGFNSRLDEIQAAILRVKLGHLDAWIEARRRLASRYVEGLGGLAPRLGLPVERPWARHSYHLFVVRAQGRERLRAWLAERHVETGIHYPAAVHQQPAYRSKAWPDGSLPESEAAGREVLSLPLFPELEEGEVDAVCEAIRGFFTAEDAESAEKGDM